MLKSRNEVKQIRRKQENKPEIKNMNPNGLKLFQVAVIT